MNTFVQLDPSKLRKGYKIKFTKNGHNFVLTSYRKPRYCDYCKKLLWGIGFHGYQCQSMLHTYIHIHNAKARFMYFTNTCTTTYVCIYVCKYIRTCLFPLIVCEYNLHKVTCHDSVESCKKVQKTSRSLFQRKRKYILINYVN